MHQSRFIIAGSCIDGSGTLARKDVFLEIRGGIITAMGKKADLPEYNPDMIDDLSHCTIVPPLVDCSVSLTRSPSIDPQVQTAFSHIDDAQKTRLFEQHIRYLHDHGVLGAADSTTLPAFIRAYQKKAAKERLINLYSSAEDCLDFIKVDYSMDIAAVGTLQQAMSREFLRHRMEQHQGKKKIVVANGAQAVTDALLAGCDAIEQGYQMGEDNLKKMAAAQVLWIPSLLRAKNGVDSTGSGGDVCCRFSLRYVAPGKAQPGMESFWKQILAGQLEQLRRARELGVPTAVGTGAGNIGIIHGESVVEEIKLFIKAGYSLEEAIHCASKQGADFFAMERIGPLRVGKPATFVVTRGTPHQLPRKMAYLENIYDNGVPSSSYRKNPVKVVTSRAGAPTTNTTANGNSPS